jgi:S1-C subfamily serine protease
MMEETVMTNGNETNLLVSLSDAMAAAAARAGAVTVLVDARRRIPASGISYAAGLVLTADHVVEREDDLRVVLPDGTELSAVLAGRDPGSDLALLRLEKSGTTALTVAEPAPRDARIGEFVLAVGRPGRDGIEASLGVISASGGPVRTGRGGLLERYLRTDAIFYPGFSGGPLVDAAGLVVGLNTSGLARGMALTIPVSLVWQTAATLAQHGHIRRGFLGVRNQPVEISAAQQQALGREQPVGLLLVGVEPGSPADQGGLLVGDIVVALDGQPLGDPDDLAVRLAGDLVGKPTPVQILRGGQPVTLQVVIGERQG